MSCPPDLGNLLPPVIIAEENIDICKIPTAEAIKKIIFGMQSLKAPGLDGLPPFIYKHFWPIVQQNVVQVVQNFFVEGKFLKRSSTPSLY